MWLSKGVGSSTLKNRLVRRGHVANPPPPRMPVPPKKPVAAWRRKVGLAVPWLLATTVAALVMQIYLAATGLLGAPEYLDTHGLFANAVIRLLYTLLLIVGFVGADWRMGVVGVVLTVLLELQYAFIDAQAATIRGLHAANGAAMLVVASVALLRRLPWVTRHPPQA
jgi:hypothetical protein